MSAIWGVIGAKIDENRKEDMLATMDSFVFDRVEELKGENYYFGCGHQIFSVKSQKNKSPFVNQDILLNSDCVLYNREELLNEIGESQQLSDDELIMKLYQKDGERFVHKLRGSFSIVIYDTRFQKVLVYGDHFSRRALFYTIQNGEFCFATVVQPILAYYGNQIAVNEKCLAAAYTDCSADSTKLLGETFYQGVYAITAGQYLKYQVENHSLQKIEYYNPLKTVKHQRHSREEWQKIFLKTFSKAATQFLITPGKTGIMLSGGLDSSAVAAMVAPELKKRNEALHTYTQVPGKDYKVKYNGLTIDDETEFVREQEKLQDNMVCSFVDAGASNVFSKLGEFTRMYQQPVKPGINISMNSAIWQKVREDGCTLMLSGQNGNATISYGSVLSYVYQKLVTLQWISAAKEARSFCKFRGISKKQFLKVFCEQYVQHKFEKITFGEDCFLKDELIKKYELLTLLEKDSKIISDGFFDSNSQHRNFCFYPRMYQQMGYYDTFNSLVYGMISEDPTLTPEVVELCLSMPMESFVHNGRERAVVRDFFKGLVPDCILENHVSRGAQAADFDYRINRDWDHVKEQVYDYLLNEQLYEYLDREKMNVFIQRIQENEKNLDRGDAATLVVLCALSSFLKEHYKQS